MALIVTGLTGDFFYSNNPIFVTIQELNLHEYITVKIGDYEPIRITPIRTNPITEPIATKISRIDISSYIKSLIPNLNQNNTVQNINIDIISWENSWIGGVVPIPMTVSSFSITKNFVLGGVRGNGTNVQAATATFLRPTAKTPYWVGYPVDESFITNSASGWYIQKTPLNPSGRSDVERRKIKGCNPTYVKFLNSLGGYSYWMFEGVTDQQKNTNSGIINNNVTIDLGNQFDRELELYSKVPIDYMPIMQDLVFSPEIYIYRLGGSGVIWDRYYSGSNTLEVNPAKSAQEVKIKLKPFNNYNPQRIW